MYTVVGSMSGPLPLVAGGLESDLHNRPQTRPLTRPLSSVSVTQNGTPVNKTKRSQVSSPTDCSLIKCSLTSVLFLLLSQSNDHLLQGKKMELFKTEGKVAATCIQYNYDHLVQLMRTISKCVHALNKNIPGNILNIQMKKFYIYFNILVPKLARPNSHGLPTNYMFVKNMHSHAPLFI